MYACTGMNFSPSHTILMQNGYLGMRFLHKYR